jgi:hypothetical protein
MLRETNSSQERRLVTAGGARNGRESHPVYYEFDELLLQWNAATECNIMLPLGAA